MMAAYILGSKPLECAHDTAKVHIYLSGTQHAILDPISVGRVSTYVLLSMALLTELHNSLLFAPGNGNINIIQVIAWRYNMIMHM